MSTTTNGGETPPVAQPGQGQPQFHVMAQYTKDFSFENPNAPQSFAQQPAQQPQQPTLSIRINSKQLSNTDFEVELQIEGKAEIAGTTLFAFELTYAGIFHLQGIPQEALAALIFIECPRILFPFAREIIASAVMGGGYPPFLLPPVDFVGLYQQKVAQAQAQQPPAQA
jgi:preprotein translocase subunit SecB